MARRRTKKPAAQRYEQAAETLTKAAEVDVAPAVEAIQSLGSEVASGTFGRSKDVLGAGDKVSARQIANVMGRWKSRHDWNGAGIGRKAMIDDYRNGDYYDEDVEQMRTDFSKPMEYYIARRPQFMDFCERYGLVARWVHRENVGSLKFPDDEAGRALAASVGATVAELNAEPVVELAADVLFDALADTGMMGFAEEEQVDRKRASFLTAGGGFNADAFSASLLRSKLNSAAALSGVRLVPPAIAFGVAMAHLDELLAMRADMEATFAANMASHPWTIVFPLLPIGLMLHQAAVGAPRERSANGSSQPRVLNYQERAILERDQWYAERMRLKKVGKLEEEYTPRVSELFKEKSYLRTMLDGESGMRFKLFETIFAGGTTRTEQVEGAHKEQVEGAHKEEVGASAAGVAASSGVVASFGEGEKGVLEPLHPLHEGVQEPATMQPLGRTREQALLAKAESDEGLTAQEAAMLEKVRIKPSKAGGASKLVAQAMVIGWVSLVPYIMMNTPL